MKILNLFITLTMLAVWHISAAVANEASSNKQSLKCETGPVNKSFGGTQWLVYACTDNKTIVIVSAPGNPSMPFYFTVYVKNNEYLVNGEGTGSKEASKSAFTEIRSLSKKNIEALIDEAKKA